jgi:putative salt-induced outer membrane protein YdiY
MRFAVPSFVSVLALTAGLAPALAGEVPVPAPTWDAKLSFSHLATSGNTQTSSSGFEAGFNRAWRDWSVEGSAAGVSAARKHRRTAESYNALGRLKRRLKKRLLVTLGLRWERNRFAGLDSRHTVDLSALWEIRDTPVLKLRALGGLSFGREEPVGSRPATDSFGGLLQLGGDFKLSDTATWDGQLTLFPNFNDAGDYRFQGHLGLQAALNRHLGLRLGYDLKYDHEPVKGFGTTDTATTAALVVQLGRKSL